MLPGEVPLASCLSGMLSKISKWTDPGSFQISASVLGLRVCELLCTPFKSGFSVSYSPLALLYASLTGFQGAHLLIEPPAPQDWGNQCGAQTPCSMGRTFAIVIILPFAGHLPRILVLTIPCLCPSYLSHCNSFFISRVVKSIFC